MYLGKQGDLQNGLDFLLTALKELEKNGPLTSLMNCISDIAIILDLSKNYNKAIYFYERAINMAEKHGYYCEQAKALMSLGSMFSTRYKESKSVSDFHEGISYYDKATSVASPAYPEIAEDARKQKHMLNQLYDEFQSL